MKYEVEIKFTVNAEDPKDLARHVRHIANGIADGTLNGYVIGDDGKTIGEWKMNAS